MPLQYPLAFPYGTPFYDIDYKKEDPNSSMLRYYRQHIFRNTMLHNFGGIFNEFLVDGFSAVIEERLNFLRWNQLRICPRSQLQNNINEVPGKTFLPASFLGSRAHQQQMIADALAIVGRFGNPTFFITFTCNPRWDIIRERLLSGQCALDRPEIVVQVFKAMLQQFIAELPKILGGKKIYRIHVIEFQKRGTSRWFFPRPLLGV